ncbi:WG repeat-containing protein [Flammeovirga pectinis]|uniref:WG repeat-containing protein n=1 Tax=Flammeovirga pectinis TaxID=2494373 RepID=A0A3S9P7Q8_9BACT|nr:WG repeat-containing protein [Flammeovirga pectinis]AZQ64239.1 WG repeat-containing protein [Flammeovirga pectinis]
MNPIYIKKIIIALIVFSYTTISNAQNLKAIQAEDSGLYGFKKDTDIDWKISPQFENAFNFSNVGIAVVKTREGYSLINTKGKRLTDDYYDRFGWADDADTTRSPLFYGNLVGVKKNDVWGVINTKGKVIISPQFKFLNYYSDGISIVENKKGRLGAVDTNGKEIIPITFQSLRFLAGGLPLLVAKNNGVQGVINLKGEWVLPLDFITVKWAGNKLLAAMTQKGEWLFVYHNGEHYSEEFYSNWKWYHKQKKLLLNRNGRLGLLDENANVVFETKCKSISFNDSSIIAEKFPKIELGDINKKLLSTWYCDSLSFAGDSLIRYYTSGKVGIATSTGKNKFYNFYSEVSDFIDGQAIVNKNNKFGVCDINGVLIVPVKYNSIKRMPTGHYWTLDKESYPDVYNKQGENLTMHKYDMIGEFSQGKYLVRRARLYGYLNADLSEWIEPQFKDAESFVGPYAVVRTSDYYGVIDLEKKWEITPIIDRLKTISQGLFYFEDNQQWGTLDINGIEWFRTDSATVESFTDGFVVMKRRGNYGLLTNKGELTLHTRYDSLDLSHLKNDRVDMYLDSTWLYKSVFDEDGEPLRNAYTQYSTIEQPTEGFAAVKVGERYGFMDYLGRMRLSCRYQAVKPFSEGLSAFELNNRWGYINKEDQIVLQPKYQELMPLKEDMAKAKLRGKWGVINHSGKNIIPFNYENVERSPYNNWYVWEKGGEMGIYTPGGIKGIYGKYDNITDLGNDYVIVNEQDKLGIDRIDGFLIWPQRYNSIKLLSNKEWFSLKYKGKEIYRKLL